ncbi:hypothetical protein BLNAU_11902 [Blattamonas nauphoetae]|uniref:Uncharacterized protein n=1 Tax=Blattamonas nauphoetae TaxID=2049346 RepID=A0ABQ9XP08_9EUKA|nr:hypothetical protein BLNAU_11902 [Blattamonas nauphoetae]
MHTAPEDMPFVPPAISYVRYQENIIPEDKMGVNPRLREMRRPQLHKDASAIEQANEQMKFEIDERIHERVHGAEPERQSLFDFVVAQRAGLHNVGDPPPRRSTTLESYLGPTDEIGSPTERREKRKTMMMNDYRDYLQNWLDNN